MVENKEVSCVECGKSGSYKDLPRQFYCVNCVCQIVVYEIDKFVRENNIRLARQKINLNKPRSQISQLNKKKIHKKYNEICCNCGYTSNNKKELHVDHILPVIKGGNNEESNLQLLCRRCNLLKYTMEFKAGEVKNG